MWIKLLTKAGREMLIDTDKVLSITKIGTDTEIAFSVAVSGTDGKQSLKKIKVKTGMDTIAKTLGAK